jgi:hypothetical protein
MGKTTLLRLVIWASASLTVLFQTAFLFELHSPLPSALVLWSLSILSIACVAVVLFVRGSLAAKTRSSYEPERAALQPHLDTGAEYRVQGVYCIVLCRQPSLTMHYARIKSFYLSEGSAHRAVTTAAIENPHWRAIGVEPSTVSVRINRSQSTSPTWHVA